MSQSTGVRPLRRAESDGLLGITRNRLQPSTGPCRGQLSRVLQSRTAERHGVVKRKTHYLDWLERGRGRRD